MEERRLGSGSPGEKLALWISAAAIVYAPLAFGTTTAATRQVLDALIVLPALILICGRDRKFPNGLPSPLLAALGLLNLTGLIFVLNPKFAHDERLDYLVEVPGAISWLPGSFNLETTRPEVLHITCLSLFLLALTRLCASQHNRWFLLRTIAVSGFLIALIGIYQKASGATSMLWTSKSYEGQTFFAAFRYHGNAVAFLNLCWPAALALLLRALKGPDRNFLATTWWSNCLLFTFGALLVNTSKFGHLAVVPGAILGFLIFKRGLPNLLGNARANGFVVALLVIVFLAILSLFSAEIVSAKWADAFGEGVSFKRRLLAYETALRMWHEAGFFGYGPGTFRILFPYHSVFAGTELGGKWTFAHQDYLQALVEWGLVGAAAIFFVFAGAAWNLILKHRRGHGRTFSAGAAMLACTIAAMHSLIDFPLQIGAIQAIVAVYLGIAWAPGNREPPVSGARKSSRAGSSPGSRQLRNVRITGEDSP